MTVEEAKRRWCPFARDATEKPSGNRRIILNEVGWPVTCYCIADQCMGWKWDQVPPKRAGDRWPDSKTDGHCGLAR